MRPADGYEPRNLTAPEYIRALFGSDDNVAVLIRNRSTGRTVQRIARAEAVASRTFQSWLAHQSAGGSDVYLGMNPIKDGAFSRTKNDIKMIRHVYLDLDRNAGRALEAIRNSSDVPQPNFVLDTSPGKHQVVWKVSGLTVDEAESLLHDLANQFGGDLAATDATRVLRLPGFANRKLPDEFIVQARQESDSIHQARDFAIHDGSPETARDSAASRSTARMPPDHKSQSERDWAYAKRALARGDDPEVVIARIADYRGIAKSDPDYYARRTVARAHADLRRGAEKFEEPESPTTEDHGNSEDQRGVP
jgi:RepB DNA-primase from phage plasmid